MLRQYHAKYVGLLIKYVQLAHIYWLKAEYTLMGNLIHLWYSCMFKNKSKLICRKKTSEITFLWHDTYLCRNYWLQNHEHIRHIFTFSTWIRKWPCWDVKCQTMNDFSIFLPKIALIEFILSQRWSCLVCAAGVHWWKDSSFILQTGHQNLHNTNLTLKNDNKWFSVNNLWTRNLNHHMHASQSWYQLTTSSL